jgi:hypothetical protein
MDTTLHNATIADRLSLAVENLRDAIADTLANITDMAPIDNEADVLVARDLVLSLKALQGQVDAMHKREKAPYLEGGRVVDRFFKGIRVGLDAAVEGITANVSAYQARKLAAERATAAFLDEAPPKPAAAARVSDEGGVVISGSIRWDFEVTDIDAVPRELMQINTAAVKARISGLKATMDITKAAGAIPGIKVVEKISPTFR